MYLLEQRRLICFKFVFFHPSTDQPQDIDKTRQTTFVDVVEVALFPYHQKTAAVT